MRKKTRGIRKKKYYRINGKTYDFKGLLELTGKKESTVRKRLRIIKQERLPVKIILDNSYWRGRGRGRGLGIFKRFFETSQGFMSYKDIAAWTGKTESTLRKRAQVIRDNRLSFDLMLDNEFWEENLDEGRKKGIDKIRKDYVERKKYQTKTVFGKPRPNYLEYINAKNNKH